MVLPSCDSLMVSVMACAATAAPVSFAAATVAAIRSGLGAGARRVLDGHDLRGRRERLQPIPDRVLPLFTADNQAEGLPEPILVCQDGEPGFQPLPDDQNDVLNAVGLLEPPPRVGHDRAAV